MLDNRNKKPTEDTVKEVVEQEAPEVVQDEPTDEDFKADIIADDIPEETTEEIPKEEEAKEETPEVDYKDRYTESSREAMVLFSKNKKITETIDAAAKIEDVSDAEVEAYARAHGTDPEYMDEITKSMLKDTLVNKKRFDKIQEVVAESKKIDEWAGKVDEYIESEDTTQKYPVLEDSVDEFKSFAMKPSRRGMDFDDLTASFLFSKKPKAKKKGSLLLNGNSVKAPAKPKGLTAEDLAVLRRKDPREYKRVILSGQLKDMDI